MKFRLGAVLRARKAQEDAARSELQQARAELEAAAARTRRMNEAIDAGQVPVGGTAAAYTATLMARQSMAAALAAARGVTRQAEDVVTDRQNDLTDAATRRRTVERLAERHAEVQRRAEEAAAQLEIDDLTTSKAHRRRPEGDDT
jgi:flagellar export protein FliJ